jgi:hypothetical protein
MAKRTQRRQEPKAPPPQKHPAARVGGPPRGTRAEALDLIFESAERDGEGFRHGALGMPRVGKTYHLKEVVDEAQERGVAAVVLIHDVKKRDVQYEGIVRTDPDDLRARPPAETDPPVIVFHPRAPGRRRGQCRSGGATRAADRPGRDVRAGPCPTSCMPP